MMSEAKLLKDRGNAAFKAKKFEEAIQLFKQAVIAEESLPTQDSKLLAILHSNVAQIYLELKNYEQVIVSATLSLTHNQLFFKSILRRAVAYFELGKLIDSVVDLRNFLKSEPINPKAIEVIRKIIEPISMSDSMRFAFVGHYLRRGLTKIEYHTSLSRLEASKLIFCPKLLRVTFVSSQMSRATKYFWDDGRLNVSSFESKLCYFLHGWFIKKSLRFGIRSFIFPLLLTEATIKTVFVAVQPSDVLLFIPNQNLRVPEICTMYNFEDIYDQNTVVIATGQPKHDLIENFQRISKHLMTIPYFEGIERLQDTTFPKIDKLLFWSNKNLSVDFLKLWDQCQWPVKSIIIEGTKERSLDLRLFGQLSCSTKKKITSIYYTICSGTNSVVAEGLQSAYRNLAILKESLPSVSEFVGKLNFTFDEPQVFSEFISRDLKAYMRFLVNNIDAEKFRLFRESKLYSPIVMIDQSSASVKSVIEKVKQIVKELRREISAIESIRFPGPKKTFDWSNIGWPYAVVDIKAKGIEFQVALFSVIR